MTTFTTRPAVPAFPPIPPRPTLAETLAEIGVRKVRVTATVTFEAYVLDDHDERPEPIEHRIAAEVRDAVAYRAPHLTDTEPGDALVVLHGDVVLDAPDVDVEYLDRLDTDVKRAVELAGGYAGEL